MKRTPWLGAVSALALLSSVASAPRVAYAQTAVPAPRAASPATASPSTVTTRQGFTPAQLQEAEDRWKEGRALYEDGKVDDARLKYAQALVVLQRTNILWNLAIAEFYSNRPLDALRHFKQFVVRNDADPADVKRANDKYIPESAQQTGHLVVEAAPGLEIIVDDDLQQGATPFRDTVDVNPGPHRVHARYRGAVESKDVACTAGRTIVVKFEMQTAEPGKETVVVAYPRARSFLTVGLAVGAIAATGVAVVFALDSKSRDDDNRGYIAQNVQNGSGGVCADRGGAACVAWQDRLDSQQTSATLSKVFYVTGGVLAAGALVTWFAWPKPKTEAAPKSTAWVLPSFTPGGGAVHVGGSF